MLVALSADLTRCTGHVSTLCCVGQVCAKGLLCFWRYRCLTACCPCKFDAGLVRQSAVRVSAVVAPEAYKVYEKEMKISKGNTVKVRSSLEDAVRLCTHICIHTSRASGQQ